MSRRILYFPVHETLEYDDLRMLTDHGHRVFSLGAFQDKERPRNRIRDARPEFFSPEDAALAGQSTVKGEDGKHRFLRAFVERFDLVIVNHRADPIFDNLDALDGTPVIFRTLGQSSPEIECSLAPLADRLNVVRYSRREVWEGCLPTAAFIPFGKYPADFPAWQGGGGPLTFMNRANRLGAVPQFHDYVALTDGLGASLHGLHNEDVPIAKGTLTPAAQMAAYRDCGCYLYTHSLTASYTLNLIEAMLVGCPIIAPSAKLTMRNGFGNWWPERYEVEELLSGGAGLIYDSVEEGRALIASLTPELSARLSRRARERAVQLFDAATVRDQWSALIETVCAPLDARRGVAARV